MNDAVPSCLVISDFTIQPLIGLLTNDQTAPLMKAVGSPFGEVMPTLLDHDRDCWRDDHDVAVVWTQPQAVVSGFGRLLEYERIDPDRLLGEVDEFCDAVERAAERVRWCLVMNWVIPSFRRAFGVLEMKPPEGITHALTRMNLRLYDRIAGIGNAHVMDSHRWFVDAGSESFNQKLWYTAKVPFSNRVFLAAMRDIKSTTAGLSGLARKLVIVDLDDTLWGGIVGDDGWENLRIGGHDHIGEAFADVQRALKALTRRGILLGIVSKNTEEIALEAFQKHTGMVLTTDDFAGWRINWNDKAANIVELVQELNLGLQSVVFLDDSAVERDRVREALSEVLVPELSSDKTSYPETILGLTCFDSPGLSTEDEVRAGQYLAERKRRTVQKEISSHEDWIQKLGVEVVFERLSPSNLERTAQLLNKTNQMNMATRRMTQIEFLDWERADNHHVWVCRVSDKFGDSGLTGIMSMEVAQETAKIVDFVLSCRVMGRNVERAMVAKLWEFGRTLGVSRIEAEFIPTKKNRPCREFWLSSGFEYDDSRNLFSWKIEDDYPVPDEILVVGEYSEKIS